MPRFSTRPIKEPKKGISQTTINRYRRYIQKLDADTVGVLRFGDGEDDSAARKALAAAAEQMGLQVAVRKPRGVEGSLEIRLKANK